MLLRNTGILILLKTYRQHDGALEWCPRFGKNYGQRLFELYDLRQPDLWGQYISFMKEFHRIKKSKSYFSYPAQDKVC